MEYSNDVAPLSKISQNKKEIELSIFLPSNPN